MILIIDDDIAVRTSLELLLRQNGFEVILASDPAEAKEQLAIKKPELVLLDLNFSRDTSGVEGMEVLTAIRKDRPNLPVILITGWGSIELAVQGMRLGAGDFLSKPWNDEYLLQAVRTQLDIHRTESRQRNRKELDQQFQFSNIIGEDPKLLSVLDTLSHIADTDASVLITGESGTGKELVAEAIHQNSRRRGKPFVKVNLGGISSSLFESEMFGHVRGSFTDARFDRVGRFEMASKGTIFLDEIGELDGSSQVKLLRVLQDRTYEVLGSSRTKVVDVRVISATNKNLDEMVQQGLFREDLLYRINLIHINLPPLRERPADIPLLVNFFVENLKKLYNRPELQVSKEAIKFLKQLPLPGNIRQLKNLTERAILLNKTDLLQLEDFSRQVEASGARRTSFQLPGVGMVTLEQMEVEMIRKAMEFHKNKIARAASSLGLTRSALYRRLEKYNIPYDEDQD